MQVISIFKWLGPLSFLSSVLICLPVQAAESVNFSCPSKMYIDDISLTDVSRAELRKDGWQVPESKQLELQLSGFNLMLGHEEPYADLKGDNSRLSKNGAYFSSHELGGASDVSIRCDYQLGLVKLVKHLDGKFKRCQVTAQMKGKQFNPSVPNFISSHEWTCFE